MHHLDVPLPDVEWPRESWLNNTFVERAVDDGIRILVVVVLTVLARWLVLRILNRAVTSAERRPIAPTLLPGKTRSKPGQTGDESHRLPVRPGVAERRRARTQATASLLRSITTGFFGIVAVVTILSILDVPIGPLLTSAGIAGVAIGFGAQTLVKDFISGIFMMLEDQYGIGDYVDVGSAQGTVEAVGLRITRLRDAHGTVWYVRNGEILRVGNSSQNWARTDVDITVGTDADLAQVEQVVKAASTEFYTSPDFAHQLVTEPTWLGLERIDGDSFVVRLIVSTSPAHKGEVLRSFHSHLKSRFDEAGIRLVAASFAVTGAPA